MSQYEDEIAAKLNKALPVGDQPFTGPEAVQVGRLLSGFRTGEMRVSQVFPELMKVLGADRATRLISAMEAELAEKSGPTPVPDVRFLDGNEDNWGVDDNSAQVMVCEVCQQQLNRFSGADLGQVWVHPRAFSNYDHEPVPKLIDRTDAHNTQCDFCGNIDTLYWKYVGKRMRAQFDPKMINDFGTVWGACKACSDLINDGDLDGLLTRVMRESPTLTKGLTRNETTQMRAKLLDLWSTFLPTVTEKVYIGPQREPAKINARMMPKLQAGLLKFWRNSNLADMFAKNRSPSGSTFSLPGVHCGDEDRFLIRFPPNVPILPQYWQNHVAHLTAGIEGADLYWISSDFTQLAIMAGKDFDKLVISREELPSTFGFMIYDSPIFEINRPHGVGRIRAVTWTLVPSGIWLNLYLQGEDGDPTVDVEQMRLELGWLMCPNVGSGIPFNQEMEFGDYEHSGFLRTIFATWFLMQQPGVAESSAAPVDKKIARAYQRSHGRKLPDVKLVDLRRQKSRGNSSEEHREGRKLSVRVYRSGHWKRQAYGPKYGMRKTIYISPYIAGPEGAPLKERPTVVKVLR